MTRKLVAIILAVFAAVRAQMTPSDQAAVDAYRAAIRSAENGATRIEAAFSALTSLEQVLMSPRGNQGALLESISGEEFERLRRELPGALINREEVVFVRPDPVYFAKLAGAHGDAADRAFFAALKATYPDSVWPAYIQPQTDYSGCTRFGSGKLTGSYRAWAEFQRRFPRRYAAAAQREIDEVISQVTESTCACGNAASVQDELQRFLTGFQMPAPLRTKAGERLQALRARRSDIRTSCISG